MKSDLHFNITARYIQDMKKKSLLCRRMALLVDEDGVIFRLVTEQLAGQN